ncbi:glycoside hydrolase family 13 protein [Microbulbifer pacificus]|uniref:Glycoside hydrolase family 13 protein n=1 Tax=Microbulbifer pacificus TaxID=407164 RepID=A0AAU0N2R0_9GAMM|nr:glycoside hydrolase family 13 protein [Microbulbifer pacificus]WOX07242.1 glycoside hydrolase family 13 protein [Microbulbifer pacificus]
MRTFPSPPWSSAINHTARQLASVAALAFGLCGAAHGLCPAQSDATPVAPIQLNQQGEFVPEWAKSAIWYQIFPERFRNGDPDNDPKVTDLAGSDPQEPVAHWSVHPWGSDWYELQEYEQKNGDKELWKHLLRRRYGGDLQGVIDKLDYLQELGINAIYLNPVFDSPSLHKYDGASYHHIDPNFGPDPEGDRRLMATEKPIDPSTWVWTKADELALELIQKAHSKGIRVIFDGVFNHMGINSFAFQDLKKNQHASPYKDWFTVTSWDDDKAGTGFDYEGWFGVKSLPEFAEDVNGLADGPKNYVFAATERWMNPKGKGREHGIDGWRLDVAYCVGHRFWKQWREHVKTINPDAYLTAEIVDTPDKVKPYLQGDEFDGEMNYNFAFSSAEFFFHPKASRISASEFDRELARLRTLYPKGVAYVTQNLFGSHDSNRIGSHIVNRGIGNFREWGKYFNTSQAAGNPEYQVRKPNDHERQLQKLFAIFQLTYVGAPMIYYGDEVGMWGANDPDDRKPMVWADIDYADEVYNPDGSKRKPDSVAVDKDLLAHYRELSKIRGQYDALRVGEYRTILADDDRDVFAFERHYQGQQLWIVLNNHDTAQRIELDIDASTAAAVDLLSGERFEPTSGKLSLPLNGKWGRVLALSAP